MKFWPHNSLWHHPSFCACLSQKIFFWPAITLSWYQVIDNTIIPYSFVIVPKKVECRLICTLSSLGPAKSDCSVCSTALPKKLCITYHHTIVITWSLNIARLRPAKSECSVLRARKWCKIYHHTIVITGDTSVCSRHDTPGAPLRHVRVSGQTPIQMS